MAQDYLIHLKPLVDFYYTQAVDMKYHGVNEAYTTQYCFHTVNWWQMV